MHAEKRRFFRSENGKVGKSGFSFRFFRSFRVQDQKSAYIRVHPRPILLEQQ
jgi:hypothetical protein